MPVTILKPSRVCSLIRRFAKEVTPEQAIPVLGDKLHLVPTQAGLFSVEIDDSSADGELHTAKTTSKNVSEHGVVVLFGARSEPVLVPSIHPGRLCLVVSGHEMLSPIPSPNHKSWVQVVRDSCHDIPYLRDLTNQFVDRADILMLVPHGHLWKGGCFAYAIFDASQL